jgi:hypothetical protein
MITKTLTDRSVKGLFIAGILLTGAFWIISKSWNVYKYEIIGTLFEIAWLPIILVTLVLPITSFYKWYRDKWRSTSVFLYISLLSFIPIYLMIR